MSRDEIKRAVDRLVGEQDVRMGGGPGSPSSGGSLESQIRKAWESDPTGKEAGDLLFALLDPAECEEWEWNETGDWKTVDIAAARAHDKRRRVDRR
jgi:hypothetical protein